MSKSGKTFYHKGLKYDFKLAKIEQTLNIMPPDLYTQADGFFDYILSKKFPFDLFNDNKITRCSTFRIKGLKRGGQSECSRRLIENKQILAWNSETPESDLSQQDIPPSIISLPKYCQNLYKDYTQFYGEGTKPSHEQILTSILLGLNQAIAIEVPVWMRKQTRLTDFAPNKSDPFTFAHKISITGHIDLLLYNENTKSLTVADYKPEGHFLRSLPQVATYGLILKRILKIEEIKCVSFNKEGLWYYDPNILRTSIEDELLEYPNLKLKWRKYVRDL